MRVGLISPCVGIGGADALMLGLIKYAHNLTFTGVAVRDPISLRSLQWTRRMTNIPLHQAKNNYSLLDGINYHNSYQEAIEVVCEKADIIFSWGVFNLSELTKNLDLPIIDYVQNTDEYAKEIVKSNLNITYYHAACSIAASKVIPEELKRNVIYNGIDPGRVTPRIGRNNQRKVWGLSNRKILLYMGRFVDEKHPSSVLAALSYLGPEWVGVFVGMGPQETFLQQQAQIFTPDRTYFVDPQFHVGDILAASDVFILPSDFEGHSLALTEAWLAGIPTVFTDFEVMIELQEQFGMLGVMVPRLSDGLTLSKAILKADSQNDEIFAIVGNAKTVVWEHFTLPAICAQWESFINVCLFDWNNRKIKGEIFPVIPPKIRIKP